MTQAEIPEEIIRVERSHSFDPRELERLQQRWVPWPREDKVKPFDEAEAVARAVKSRHYEYDNSPSYWADMSVVRGEWSYTDGLLSREETAFWFSLCVAKGFIYGNYDDPEVTPKWVRERMSVVSASDDYKAYFQAMTDNDVFDDYYGYQQILARFLREVAPYDEALRFLADHMEVSVLSGWITELGPPPQEMQEKALAVMQEIFAKVDYDAIWLGSNIAKMLTTIPYQPAIEELLTRHTAQKRDWDSETILMTFQLEDREQAREFLSHVKRWGYHRPTDEEVMRFFGYFGFESPELLFKKIIWHYRKKSDFAGVLKTALKIKSPEIAVLLYDYIRNSQIKPIVEEYVLSGEPHALEGLLQLTHSRSKKREWALQMMRQLVGEDEQVAHTLKLMAEQHHPGRIATLIEEQFFASPDEISVRAGMEYIPEAELTDWMQRLMQVRWPAKRGQGSGRPEWLRPESLPTLYLPDDERALPFEVTDGFLAAARHLWDSSAPREGLAGKALKEAHAALEHDVHTLLDAVRPGSSEHLIIEVMRVWDATQDPTHGEWVLALAGERGGVAVTASIDHYVREARDWTARRTHQDEAKHAIRILAELDSPEARHDLLWQSQHLQDFGLRTYAKTILEAYKKEHELDDAEFEDAAVPTFDLERGGTRLFDFGTRQLKLMVRGRHDIGFMDVESKKVFARFPPQRKSDDADKYASARDQYMHISEPLRLVFDEQNSRMEKLMLTGRTWKPERWTQLIGQHPILGHLARRLLWKIVDADFKTQALVLPDASGSFMDLDFDEVSPDPDSQRITLVHPIELSSEQLSAWVEQLADFEIIQPFDQLERPLYLKADAQAQTADLSGYMDDRTLIEGVEMGWEACKNRYRSVDKLRYSPPDQSEPIQVELSGALETTSDGQLRKAAYSYISLSCISREGDANVWKDGKLVKKHFAKVSELAWSEAILLIKRALAAKAS